MASRVHPLWVFTVGVAVILAGTVAGYEVGRSGTAAGPPGPGSGSRVLSITAAGTLGSAFGAVARLLANGSPGVQVPSAAQQYHGSIAALSAITQAHGLFDVAASADFRLIPRLLIPSYASWEVLFASNPEVLVYDPTEPALAGLNRTNWAQKIGAPGVVLGVADAATDPNGYNAIFVLELEGLREGGTLSTVYGHFFRGNPGEVATVVPEKAKVEPETQVATLLGAHIVQAYVTYRSYAVTHQLSYVPLDPSVDLGSFDVGALSNYARASTTIATPGGPAVAVRGAPVGYAVTVPSNAPNATLGAQFVALLLSAQGRAILSSFGFSVVAPAYAFGPGLLPNDLRPEVAAMPASLAGEVAL